MMSIKKMCVAVVLGGSLIPAVTASGIKGGYESSASSVVSSVPDKFIKEDGRVFSYIGDFLKTNPTYREMLYNSSQISNNISMQRIKEPKNIFDNFEKEQQRISANVEAINKVPAFIDDLRKESGGVLLQLTKLSRQLKDMAKSRNGLDGLPSTEQEVAKIKIEMCRGVDRLRNIELQIGLQHDRIDSIVCDARLAPFTYLLAKRINQLEDTFKNLELSSKVYTFMAKTSKDSIDDSKTKMIEQSTNTDKKFTEIKEMLTKQRSDFDELIDSFVEFEKKCDYDSKMIDNEIKMKTEEFESKFRELEEIQKEHAKELKKLKEEHAKELNELREKYAKKFEEYEKKNQKLWQEFKEEVAKQIAGKFDELSKNT